MSVLNIVLVEPQIPQNTGNIARTCAATGARLHIVKPMGFTIQNKLLKRAGLDYWHYLDITYYDDIQAFFVQNPESLCYFFTTKGQMVFSEVSFLDNSYLLFGREDAGLDEQLLYEHPEQCVRVPMATGIRSLNLANTVAIATYEVLRQWGYPALSVAGQLTKFSWNK